MQRHRTAAPVRDGGDIARLTEVDRILVDLALSLGAEERQYPVLIARETLEQAEYPQAFPHLLFAAASALCPERDSPSLLEPDNLTRPCWCLSPAVCYHAYAEIAGRTLSAPIVLTALGRCFRNEATVQDGIRQIEFEMREIVFAGPPEWVEAMAVAAERRLDKLLRFAGLEGTWEVAEDPFFLPTAGGKAMLQRLLQCKREYRAVAPPGLALVSINRHGAFFGERFEIHDVTGKPVHTACLAVGLDRWLACLNEMPLVESCHVLDD